MSGCLQRGYDTPCMCARLIMPDGPSNKFKDGGSGQRAGKGATSQPARPPLLTNWWARTSANYAQLGCCREKWGDCNSSIGRQLECVSGPQQPKV
jgi:hypothetical protein